MTSYQHRLCYRILISLGITSSNNFLTTIFSLFFRLLQASRVSTYMSYHLTHIRNRLSTTWRTCVVSYILYLSAHLIFISVFFFNATVFVSLHLSVISYGSSCYGQLVSVYLIICKTHRILQIWTGPLCSACFDITCVEKRQND